MECGIGLHGERRQPMLECVHQSEVEWRRKRAVVEVKNIGGAGIASSGLRQASDGQIVTAPSTLDKRPARTLSDISQRRANSDTESEFISKYP